QIAAGVLQVRAPLCQASIGNRLQARGDRELRKTIEPSRSTRLQVLMWVEVVVVNLGGQSRAEGRRVESGDWTHRRRAPQDARPQAFNAATNWSQRADTRDDDA